MDATSTIWRLPRILEECGDSRTKYYDDISKGLRTRLIKTGPRAAGAPAHEVIAGNKARIAGWPPAKIRELVDHLHAARCNADIVDSAAALTVAPLQRAPMSTGREVAA